MIDKNLSARIQRVLSQNTEVFGVYALGSFVKGKIHQESDFDLAVVVKNTAKITVSQIYDLLSDIKFPRDLDLSIVDKSSSPLFLFQAVSKGSCIYFKSEIERIKFETFVAKNYYDTAHLRKIYYFALKEKFPYVN